MEHLSGKTRQAAEDRAAFWIRKQLGYVPKRVDTRRRR